MKYLMMNMREQQQMRAQYTMKDLGIVHWILAVTFSINQSKYLKYVCNKFLPNGGATVQTLMRDTILSKEMSPKSDDERDEMKNIPYKAAIGCLMWLGAGTRLYIAYATQTCARSSVDPGKQHWDAEIRVMRYLKGTAGYGIVYRGNTDDNMMTDTVSINQNWSLDNCRLTHPELNLVTKSNIQNLYAYVDAVLLCVLPWWFSYTLEIETSAKCRYFVCSLSIWLYLQRLYCLYGLLSLLFVRLDIVN